ncbi:MAG: FeoA domain-containing protein [Pirellulales bacterium]
MPDLVPLTLLRSGQVGEIYQLLGAPDQVRRLEELGMRTGARLEMVRCGAPCIVRIDGSKFCFRNDDSLSILVRTRKSA